MILDRNKQFPSLLMPWKMALVLHVYKSIEALVLKRQTVRSWTGPPLPPCGSVLHEPRADVDRGLGPLLRMHSLQTPW